MIERLSVSLRRARASVASYEKGRDDIMVSLADAIDNKTGLGRVMLAVARWGDKYWENRYDMLLSRPHDLPLLASAVAPLAAPAFFSNVGLRTC